MRVLFVLMLISGVARSQSTFQSLSDRFFDEYYFPYNPTTATADGIHKYDGQLEDYSKAGVARRVAELKKFEAEFAKLPASADRDLVLNYIRASLLELETVRKWEKNPDIYSSGITSSAFTIMSRKFAPPEVRLKSLIARERQMPKVLAGRARESEESAAHLYRNRHRTTARQHRVLSRTTCRWRSRTSRTPSCSPISRPPTAR